MPRMAQEPKLKPRVREATGVSALWAVPWISYYVRILVADL